MSTEVNAKAIFKDVRERYKSSLVGSSNKKYDLDAEIFADAPPEVLVKRGMRNLKATMAHERKGREGTIIGRAVGADPQSNLSSDAMVGKQIWNMNIQKLNCDELAKMCCWKASEIPISAYLGAFDPPADHALCLVGTVNTQPLKKIKGSLPIKDYKAATLTSDVWVVDVWLNTVCHISDYPEKAARKLNDWTKAGKRITFFPPGENDEIWAAPSGEYATVFLNATMGWD